MNVNGELLTVNQYNGKLLEGFVVLEVSGIESNGKKQYSLAHILSCLCKLGSTCVEGYVYE